MAVTSVLEYVVKYGMFDFEEGRRPVYLPPLLGGW
jgi:hypothetical protein